MGRQSIEPGGMAFDLPPLPLLSDDEVIEQQPDQAALTERYVDAGLDLENQLTSLHRLSTSTRRWQVSEGQNYRPIE